jgi:hypothetical protein
LQIRVTGVPTKNTFTWKLNKADETLLGEFADPVSEDVATYRVCVYDESGGAQPLVEAEMPPMGTCDGKPCWGNTGTKGFKYRDRDETPDGVTHAKLKAGADGKAKLQVKAKAPNFAIPNPPLSLPVTVQYIIDDGATTTCWETVFNEASQNKAGLFRAKGP